MKPNVSIIIEAASQHLLRRCLWSVATRPPSLPYEVIIIGDERVTKLLQEFASCFPAKVVQARDDVSVVSHHVFNMSGAVIVWGDVFDKMLLAQADNALVATTYELTPAVLDRLDMYGYNLTEHQVKDAEQRPMWKVCLTLTDNDNLSCLTSVSCDGVCLFQMEEECV